MLVLGERLRKIRMDNNMSQRQIADFLGNAVSTVAAYETGMRMPPYETLIKFAKRFHVTTDYLLGIDHRELIDISDLSDREQNAIKIMLNALKKI